MDVKDGVEDSGSPRDAFDRIITCMGWRMDRSIFDEETAPRTVHDHKYPLLTPEVGCGAVAGRQT